MEWNIRKARKEDLAGLDEVMMEISDHHAKPQDRERVWKKIEKNPDNYLMVAAHPETGEICGSLLGVVFQDICGDCRPILLVENVAVKKSWQGTGLGRMLFHAIEAWGRERNCHYEILVSGMTRTGAHKFYDALGFEECKGYKKYL